MSSRILSTALTRPLVFRPFTTAVPIASGADAFEFRMPLLENSADQINEEQSRWPVLPKQRYIYVFVRKEALPNGSNWQDVFERFVLLESSGAKGENPLLAVFLLEGDGKQKIFAGKDIRSGELKGEAVQTEVTEFPLDDPYAAQELSVFYAVASPVLLPENAITTLEKKKPDALPDLGDGIGWLTTPDAQATPTKLVWAAPVVDPLLLTANLTKVYMKACDDWLAYTQAFEVPESATEGQVRLLKKGVAETLVGISSSEPLAGLQSGQPDKFLQQYSDELAELEDAREVAAQNLLRWIESDFMHSVEDWFREADGSLSDSYVEYSKTMGDALARLVESNVGITYLSVTLDNAKDPSKNDKPGILRFINEIVLPDERHSDQHIQVTFKSANQVFNAWSAFFTVLQTHVATATKTSTRVGTKVVQVTELRDSVVIMTKRWEMWLDDKLMQMPASSPATIEFEVGVPVKIPVRVNQNVSVEVTVTEPQIKLSPGAKSALNKLAVVTERAESVLTVLNLTLSFCAMREALRKENNVSEQLGSALDFSSAMVDLAKGTAASESLRVFRTKLVGGGASGARSLGAKAITGRLGLLGAGISLAGSTVSLMNNYEEGDWDAAAANAVEGVGAAISGVGFIIAVKSPGAGPLAGYFAFGGAMVSLGGFLWATCAEDLPLEQLMKHCAFGEEAGASNKAPGWALCKSGTFADWAPDTVKGLQTQLKGFEQLFFSFQASGVEGAPDTLRLYPASIREDSVFHIQYTARYYTDLSKDVPEGDRRRAGLQIVGHCTVHMNNLSLVTVEGDPLETEVDKKSVVERKKVEGRDVIDIRFIPSHSGPKGDDIVSFPGKESLICRILLAPYGDGGRLGDKATLGVPMAVEGAKRLRAAVIDDRRPRANAISSITDGELT